MVITRGAMEGQKQRQCVIRADKGGDDWGSPDVRRETAGKQVGITRYP